MVHELYDVNKSQGTTIQIGSGPFFVGNRFQRGYGRSQYGRGFGSILSSAVKWLIPYAQKHIAPLAKSALGAIAKEGIQAGSNILGNVASGQNFKESVKSETKKSIKNLARKAGDKLTQAGSGRKRRRVNRSLKNLHIVGRSLLNKSAKKRRKGGNLGLF